jgi:pimeloyl-ACP methyl ester carboxylesterase
MQKIVIGGLLTNYQIFGDGKETLLILPGWKRSINEWMPVAQNLSQKYKVILLDLPGFSGQTAFPKKIFGVFEYADFVKQFLAKIKVDKCILLGHSMGGRIGIVLASENKIVKKLLLVDSSGIERKNLYTKIMHVLKIISLPILMQLPLFIKDKIRNLIGSEDYKSAGEMRKTLVKVVNQNLESILPKIKVPAFIIWGDRDATLPVSQTKIFKKEIIGSKVRIVWGAGHNPHLEKTEQFLSILKEIL